MSQKVFLIPDCNENNDIKLLTLKHPQTYTPVLCALNSENRLYEVSHFEEQFSAWFINDTVSEEGKLHFLTPADPLFFILPYANTDDKFCRLEDLLIDEDFPDVHNLTRCMNPEMLSNFFDFKESSGFNVYQYQETKVLEWLQKKVNYMSTSFRSKEINVTDGAVSSLLVVDNTKQNPRVMQNFACQLIAEYLSSELRDKLYKVNGIDIEQLNAKSKKNSEGPAKKQNTSVSPTDDYSKKCSTNPLQSKQKTKLSSSQKQLLKVDKKGMKTISSFFQKK